VYLLPYCRVYLFVVQGEQIRAESAVEEWKKFGIFLVRAIAALARLGLAWIFATTTPYVERAVTAPLPIGGAWDELRSLVHGIGATFLVLLLVYLGWDMLTVFMPWLRGRKER
jgi:hypothetical protein